MVGHHLCRSGSFGRRVVSHLVVPTRPAPSRHRFAERFLVRAPKYVLNGLVGVSALVFGSARFIHAPVENGPVLRAAVTFVTSPVADGSSARGAVEAVATVTRSALGALTGLVRPLSRPEALEDAFKAYFAYKTAHPDEVRKPFLYFVDYGLASTEPRGYVFNMDSLKIVDGPFMVAHGRGSSTSQYGVPTRFSNASNSYATSLGLYVAQSTYDFHGHMGGQGYSSIGLRLQGVSHGFNDNALQRRVVAHGAPYVTPTRAGRSQGCPAMEPSRAARLLPKLADGGMVFLFAPDQDWLARDPWLAVSAN